MESQKRRPVPVAMASAATPVPGSETQTPSEITAAPVDAMSNTGADAGDMVAVRVLVDYQGNDPNDVILVPLADVERLEAEGCVDSDPEAVAYAESLSA